jgi:hypothetical protein
MRWLAAWRSALTATSGPHPHVDFLVGEEAFEHHGVLVTFRPGVPIEVDGVRIDYLSPVALGPQLEDVLDDPSRSQGLAVVPLEALIYMKLRARRRQDLLDVVELINAGADVRRVRRYLEQYGGDLVAMFDELVEEALHEWSNIAFILVGQSGCYV